MAILQAKIWLSDGTVVPIHTDATWMVGPSPVTSVDIYKGENYDARLETPGWSAGGTIGPSWAAAAVAQYPHTGMLLTSHAVLPQIKIGEDYTPCDMWESSPGVFVFDFCQVNKRSLFSLPGACPEQSTLLRSSALCESAVEL